MMDFGDRKGLHVLFVNHTLPVSGSTRIDFVFLDSLANKAPQIVIYKKLN